MSSEELSLGSAVIRSLQFLDRHAGEWYCTRCWAHEVGADTRTLHRVSVLMGTDEARLAGYEAKADGACKVHDAKGARLAGRKGSRSVRGLRKPRAG
jgi:hypothetical protein